MDTLGKLYFIRSHRMNHKYIKILPLEDSVQQQQLTWIADVSKKINDMINSLTFGMILNKRLGEKLVSLLKDR